MAAEQEKQRFWKTHQDQLGRTLEIFEESADTPFVPGELENWLKETQEALYQLIPVLQEQTQSIHADEFAEIAEEDPGLLSRVEDMREEDRAIMEQKDKLADWLHDLQARLSHGASETDLKGDLDAFVSAALELVMRTRKQEVTVRTWLVEAFDRDRGTVD